MRLHFFNSAVMANSKLCYFGAPLMHHHASELDHKSWYRSLQGYGTRPYDLAFPFHSLKFNPKVLIPKSKILFHYYFKVYAVVSGSIPYRFDEIIPEENNYWLS